MTVRQQQALDAVRAAVNEAKLAGGLPAFLGALEALRVEALVAGNDAARASRVLTVDETARRLSRSPSWVYKNKGSLPIVRYPTGGFGFDERKLERWIEARTR